MFHVLPAVEMGRKIKAAFKPAVPAVAAAR